MREIVHNSFYLYSYHLLSHWLHTVQFDRHHRAGLPDQLIQLFVPPMPPPQHTTAKADNWSERCTNTAASCSAHTLRTFGLMLSGPLALLDLLLENCHLTRLVLLIGVAKGEGEGVERW